MAVYTEVSSGQLSDFLLAYDIGDLVFFRGIADGIQNSNFILQTSRATFILTLFEEPEIAEELPYFMALLDHLAQRGIPCPTPIHRRDGDLLGQLAGRPAAISSFLQGLSARRPTVAQCQALGAALARFHLAAQSFPHSRANDWHPPRWRQVLEACGTRLDEIRPGLRDAIAKEITSLAATWPPTGLPSGTIHADLFPDNVFFLDEKLTGLIDFYAACTEVLAYDVAVCLNAWCFEGDAAFNVTKSRALLRGYQAVRPLERSEIEALPRLARGGALRFLLSRARDWLHPPEGTLVHVKDPLEYWRKLRFHQQVSSPREYGLDDAINQAEEGGHP